jgi:alpha-tubulin suppressor-like RCC1 family protein
VGLRCLGLACSCVQNYTHVSSTVLLRNDGVMWDSDDFRPAAAENWNPVVDPLGARVTNFVALGETSDGIGSSACGVRADGTAWCWIVNPGFTDAQVGWSILGNGRMDTPPAHTITQVLTSAGTPLTDVRSISGPSTTTVCAVAGDNAWCWGRGDSGQIGNGRPIDSRYAVPVLVSGTTARLTGVRRVAAGMLHACAVRNDGTVWCWGSNWFNVDALTRGTTAAAVQVQGLVGEAIDVQVGFHLSAALMRDGTVWFWGDNPDGSFGEGAPMVLNQPRRARLADGSVFDRVTQVRIGNGRHCALRDDHTVWCWGWRAGATYPVLEARDAASVVIANTHPTYLGRDGRIRVTVGSSDLVPSPCAR